MLKKSKCILFILLFSCAAFSQEKEQWIRGKIVSDSLIGIGVTVVNLVNEQTVVSDANGEFRILVKEDDMLVFPSVNYEYKRRIITADDLKTGQIIINLTVKVTELDEVVVNRDINPETLGLVPKGQKRYTRAERHLYSANSGPVDYIVNSLTGKTKMLEKIVEAEKEEALVRKLSGMFEEDYFIKKLQIPVGYVKAFQLFAVTDKDMIEALNIKNKARVKLAAIRLAPLYLERHEEKETVTTQTTTK